MMEPRPEAIAGIERTLFNTLLDITGRAYFDIFSYRDASLCFVFSTMRGNFMMFTWAALLGLKRRPMPLPRF